MPDHIHLVTRTAEPATVRRILAIEARAACRVYLPGENLWARAPEPERLPNALHLKRTIRYVHLNPCRDGLAHDPIEWLWSTHRDVLGMTARCWVDHMRMAQLFRCSPAKLPSVFHAYVSGDPSVSITGTPPPRTPEQGTPLVASVSHCLDAIASASRQPLSNILKRGQWRDAAIQLALDRARNLPDEIIRFFEVDERTLRRIRRRAPQRELLAAATRILHEPRCFKLRGHP